MSTPGGRRALRALTVVLVLAGALAFILTSCPSNRDGMPGQLASAKDDVIFEALTVPSVRFSAYHVDRGFVAVPVRFRPPTRRRVQKNHRDARRQPIPWRSP